MERDGSDRALVARFLARRSEDAFVRLYRAHTPFMYAMALRLLGGRTGAEDVVQDAWMKAIARLDTFRWESALRTWLCGFVVNGCRERWRGPEWMPMDDTAAAPPGEPSVDLERAVAALPPGARAVLLLHDLHGYTHAEIASLLGVETGTSKSQLSRARASVRARLGKAGEP